MKTPSKPWESGGGHCSYDIRYWKLSKESLRGCDSISAKFWSRERKLRWGLSDLVLVGLESIRTPGELLTTWIPLPVQTRRKRTSAKFSASSRCRTVITSWMSAARNRRRCEGHGEPGRGQGPRRRR